MKTVKTHKAVSRKSTKSLRLESKKIVPRATEDDQENEDWELIDNRTRFGDKIIINFLKKAKELSKENLVYETHLVCWKDENDDPVLDVYYRNGKVEFVMSNNENFNVL